MFTVLAEIGFIPGGLVGYTFGSIPPPKIPRFHGYNSSLVWVCSLTISKNSVVYNRTDTQEKIVH